MMTCRKIVQWRNYLKFPEDAKLPPAALDLMQRLLCDVEDRLGSHGGAEEIKVRIRLGPDLFRREGGDAEGVELCKTEVLDQEFRKEGMGCAVLGEDEVDGLIILYQNCNHHSQWYDQLMSSVAHQK